MTKQVVRAWIVAAAVGFLIAGCGQGAQARTYAGGYPIGESMNCPAVATDGDWWCPSAIAFAQSSLETGHAAIASTAVYAADWRGPDGQRVKRTYGTSAGNGVIVFGLADGSTRAYWVECVIGPVGHAADAECFPASRMPGEQ